MSFLYPDMHPFLFCHIYLDLQVRICGDGSPTTQQDSAQAARHAPPHSPHLTAGWTGSS